MNAFIPTSGFAQALDWSSATMEYLVDRTQRTILFWDVLRKRGNNYLAHLKAGQPPVLVFDYEMVLDGRYLERPVNYAIVKIIDPDERAGDYKKNNSEKSDPEFRPIVVIDPRAGHGPGIGGSKLDSQIGVALKAGHPVYFVTFYTDPEPGQTIADVQRAEVKFLEEVRRRHPHADLPAVIGNCQAGWATALIGADRPDVTGPMVFNGSPLSYWGGIEGANPMRYKGGLSGGVWLTSLWSDLGNGTFDGDEGATGLGGLQQPVPGIGAQSTPPPPPPAYMKRGTPIISAARTTTRAMVTWRFIPYPPFR